MKLSISHILRKASELPDVNDKIDWLRRNDSNMIRYVLACALDPRIVWLLPEGPPPYKPNVLVDQENRLYAEGRKLYLFLKDGHPTLKQSRRETLFIEFIETLDKDDAELIVAAKEKKLPYPGLNKDIIEKSFPGMFAP